MKKVGFVGLGNMGFPMASNLLKAKFQVLGSDVNKKAEERFAEIGGEVGYTSVTLSRNTDVIFTSLPTPQIVKAVYLGKDGLIANGVEGLTLVDLSTTSPEVNHEVAKAAKEAGIHYLGAPVSGSVTGAESASLSVMAAGEKEVYEAVLPYLEAIGKNIFHVGEDHRQGTVVKLINNLMAGIHTQAAAEALSVAEAAGLDLNVVYEIINVSSGKSEMLTRSYKHFIEKDEYVQGAFTTALLLKDLKLANEVASTFGGKLPLGATLIDYLEEHIEGYENIDMSSTYKMLRNERVDLKAVN